MTRTNIIIINITTPHVITYHAFAHFSLFPSSPFSRRRHITCGLGLGMPAAYLKLYCEALLQPCYTSGYWLRPLVCGQLCCARIPVNHSEDLSVLTTVDGYQVSVDAFLRHDTVTRPQVAEMRSSLYECEPISPCGAVLFPFLSPHRCPPFASHSFTSISRLKAYDHLIVVTCLAWPIHRRCFVIPSR